MESYFNSVDKEHYKEVILRELSEDIIDHLTKTTQKIYLSELKLKVNYSKETITTKVIISKRGFLGVNNTKICEISGEQKFQKWKVYDGNKEDKFVSYECKLLTPKLSDETSLSQKSLEDIVSNIDYKKVLHEAEKFKNKY